MFEKQNHSFDSMDQLYLIFPIADLCTAYCTSTWYKWYIQQMQSLRAVNRKVVAGFENGFFYRVSIHIGYCNIYAAF